MTDEAVQGGLFAFERAHVPDDAAALARWFSEAVQAEIAALEKKARQRRIELLAGIRRDGGPGSAIFDFELADPLVLPEDASGSVEISDRKYPASVVSQRENVIVVEISSLPDSTTRISRAFLSLDDTNLLRRLQESLDAVTETSAAGLEVAFLHPDSSMVGRVDLPERPYLADLRDPSHERALQTILGSRVTYVWGPPGTGKTHLLARLVATLHQDGERVLVTSHTHAAIDEALFKLIDGKDGPALVDQIGAVEDGSIVRVGRTTDPRVTAYTLDSIVERRSKALADELAKVQDRLTEIGTILAAAADLEARWRPVDTARTELEAARRDLIAAQDARRVADETLASATADQQTAAGDLARAQRSFILGRSGRVARAHAGVAAVETRRTQALLAGHEAATREASTRPRIARADGDLTAALARVGSESDRVAARQAAADARPEHDELDARGREIESALRRVGEVVLDKARVVFATLTKCYVSADLARRQFHSVIADEISMAMPPLLFLVARQAGRRLVLVGDFLQLSPVVRSDEELSEKRLETDAFRMAGLANELDVVPGQVAMPSLGQQRRMHPRIADIARHLMDGYRDMLKDDPIVTERSRPEWLDALSLPGPVTFVDTSSLHAWSGRDAISLSRFNIATASAATQIAALAAAGISEVPAGQRRPIGIATPYAAQRRRLAALVSDAQLTQWVLAGTVHTFQGGETDLLILDLALDEPCQTAAITMAKHERYLDQARLLNVAVTRAKYQLVVLGSRDWIGRRAVRGSALARLMEAVAGAPVVPIGDLLGPDALDRLGMAGAERGWPPPPAADGQAQFELLDERSFFARFEADLDSASSEVIALMAYVGEFRWPLVEPAFARALRRSVRCTFIVPELGRAVDRGYTARVYEHLRGLGAVVIEAHGLHGKDVLIDDDVLYTGSLNWASNRGSAEIMWRLKSGIAVDRFRDAIRAKYLRQVARSDGGTPRSCPVCSSPLLLINQGRPLKPWDREPVKVTCASHGAKHYFAAINQRAPLEVPPACRRDGQPFAKVPKGRGHVWRCPGKHRECPEEIYVRGDARDWGERTVELQLGLE